MLPSKKIVFLSSLLASTIFGLSLFGFSEAKPIVSSTLTKSPAAQATSTKLKVGVSIPAADHGWTAGVVWWAKECSKLHPEIEWTIATAETPEKQIADIEAFMAKKVDALVILATESAPLTPVVVAPKPVSITIDSKQEFGSSTELMEALSGVKADAPLCMTCGVKMRMSGACYVCEGCGNTSGCS